MVGDEIQLHFGGRAPRKTKSRAANSNRAITAALAGGVTLNASLTRLEQGYEQSRLEMHLSPSNLRRVVDTALRINHQQPLIENFEFAEDTEAEVFSLPTLTTGWQNALRGLDTRLNPGVQRPITFDSDAFGPGSEDKRSAVVQVHLGHPIVQKAQRLLRRALWSVDSPLRRVTAVVVQDLDESSVAAVTRMVLVGRGGLRLHEEVFLAGVRLRGRRAMAEATTEAVLERALDSERLVAASSNVREELHEVWQQPDSSLRQRLEASMQARAADRHDKVLAQLVKRQEFDAERATAIFAAFRSNLQSTLVRLRAEEDEARGQLFSDPEQQRQWRRDIDAMTQRLDAIDDEESRELAAISERYSEVRPHVTAAAIVFALTPADAEGGIA